MPEPGNPQSLNRYSYVGNNPLRYVDPTGHDWVDALDFLYGFGAQLALANTFGASPMQEALAANPDEPVLTTAGRHLGNVAAMVQGVAEIVAGATVDVGGAGLCLTGVGCLAGAPAAVAGTAVAIHGAAVTGAGVVMEGQMLGDLILKARNGSTIKAIDPPSDRGGLRRVMEKAGTKPPGMVNSQAHHNLPWKFREWFAAEGRGLNVNDPRFGRWVEGSPPGQHQNWTRAYEDVWAGWIQRNPNATQQQVLDFLNQLLSSGTYP